MTRPLLLKGPIGIKALFFSSLATFSGLANPVGAVPNYLTRVPHSDGGSCLPCHSSGGGSPRTQFGLDFAANGYDWEGIWNLDSDGDGQSNGEELGDPCGAWLPGEETARTDFISAAEDPDKTSDFPLGGTTLWFFDQDEDGVGRNGAFLAQCEPPAGYASTQGDCDDENANIWSETSVYADEDGDGFGAGPEVLMCIGDAGPAGYVSNDSDCNDDIAEVYQLLPGYVDGDLDGEGGGQLQWVCSGSTLPGNFSTTGEDCDDTDPAVASLRWVAVDVDGDGYAHDAPQWRCQAGQMAEGFVEFSACVNLADCPAGMDRLESEGQCTPQFFDCDDDDPEIFKELSLYPDLDEDGFGAGDATNVCTGNIAPVGWSESDADCDDTPTSGAGYFQTAWRYVDEDGDGYTLGALVEVCMGAEEPDGYSAGSLGEDCDDTEGAKFKEAFGYPDLDQDGVSDSGRIICGDGGLPEHWTAIKYGQDCDDNNGTVPAFTCEDLPDACGIIDDGCPPPGTYCGPCPETSDAGSEDMTRDAGRTGDSAGTSVHDAGQANEGTDEADDDQEEDEDDDPEPPNSGPPDEEAPAAGCFGDQMPNDFAKHNWMFALMVLGMVMRRNRGRR